jgi:hypothetical protein
MKLKSFVQRATGNCRHTISGVLEGRIVEVDRMPTAAWVLLEGVDGHYELFRYSADGEFAGDTWHDTLDEAKRQAAFECEIREADWRPEPSD